MKIKKIHFKKGQVLIIVSLVFVAVLAITTVALFSRTANFLRLGGNYTKTEQAVNITEAGIEEAVREINSVSTYGGELNTDLESGEFETTVSGSGSTRTVRSIGYVPDQASAREQKEITVDLEEISLTPQIDPPGGSLCSPGASPTETWQHTIGSGPNRLLAVIIATWTGAHQVTSVTYNGLSLTKTYSVSPAEDFFMAHPSGDTLELWYLKDPPVGTHDAVITFNTSGSFSSCGSTSWSGVNQSTTFGTLDKEIDDSPYDITISADVPGATGQTVIDALAYRGGFVPTADVGQTVHYNTSGPFIGKAHSSRAGAPPSVTMRWTFPPAGNNAKLLMAVPLLPAAVGEDGDANDRVWVIKKGTYRFGN